MTKANAARESASDGDLLSITETPTLTSPDDHPSDNRPADGEHHQVGGDAARKSKSGVSRRDAMNMMVSAAALVAATPAAALQVANEVDPIFAAIERHRTTYGEFNSRCSELDEAGTDEAQAEHSRLWDAAEAAALQLLDIGPATLAGVIAILRYVVEFEHEGNEFPSHIVDGEGDDAVAGSFAHFLHRNLATALAQISAGSVNASNVAPSSISHSAKDPEFRRLWSLYVAADDVHSRADHEHRVARQAFEDARGPLLEGGTRADHWDASRPLFKDLCERQYQAWNSACAKLRAISADIRATPASGLFSIGCKLAGLEAHPEVEDYQDAVLSALADIDRMLGTGFSDFAIDPNNWSDSDEVDGEAHA